LRNIKRWTKVGIKRFSYYISIFATIVLELNLQFLHF